MTDGHHHRACAALRSLFGLAALLGLFAMHGLVPHGTAHGGHVGDATPVVAVSGDHSPAPKSVVPVADPVAMVSAGTHDTPDGALRGLAGMCLAVLLTGLAVALLLGMGLPGQRQADPPLWARRRPRRARRDRDPPCLFALSIQRC
jgi:hypothetical protein